MANSAKKLMGKAGFSFLALLILVLGTLNPEPAYAGWKTKAALTAGTILAGQAIKKCIQPSGCPKMLMDKLGDHLVKHPEHRQKLLEIVQTRATTQFKDRILKSPSARESYEKLVHFIRGSGTRKSGVPDQNFKPNPSVKDSYQRPTAAGPTKAQKEYVQGKPCVDCGRVTPTQVADHKKPLVVEHYEQGVIDVAKQRTKEAVQPHCPTCSSQQGGQLGQFVKRMKKLLQDRTSE
jgi:hypothetical protein